MHRQTGAASGFRGYSSGGARALIEKVDDSQLMQAMNGSGMKGEAFSASGDFKGPESPQNYGFTSVVAAATKGANGMIKQCAEGFMSFIGGNRSFPVCGIMDDRRHRLKNLGKDAADGSTAIFGLKEWGQQFLNTDNGMFMTGNTEKKVRLQLVENQNGKKQQQSSSSGARTLPTSFVGKSGVEFEIETFVLNEEESRIYDREIARGRSVAEAERAVAARSAQIAALAAGGGGNGAGGGGQQGESKPTGQKTLHKEESKIWIEQNKKETASAHGDFYSSQRTGSDSTIYYKDRADKSAQATDSHTHIKHGMSIWVADGCFSDEPILVKKDGHCKK